MIFALSITPRLTLHHLFSNHEDGAHELCGKNLEKTLLSKSGTYCKCIDLVVKAPFADYFDPVHIIVPVFFPEKKAAFYLSAYSSCYFYSAFRGPPSLV